MVKNKNSDARVLAARALEQVIKNKRSLRDVLPDILQQAQDKQSGLIHELTAGTLRWWWQLSAIIAQLLQKPLKGKDFDIEALIALGVYQIEFTRVPAHAAVSETVNAAALMGKPWAKKLVNAVLRNFLRNTQKFNDAANKDETFIYSHPKWMITQIKKDWPLHWQTILEANNQLAPLTLRVNQQTTSTDDAIEALASIEVSAVKTLSSPVGLNISTDKKIWQTHLWDQALFSVQDESAQLVAQVTQLKPKMKVLDACAAPGGKTAHLLETQPDIDLTALDIQTLRVQQLKQNLERLNLDCTVKTADARDLNSWWQGAEYDLIIIDAPCSGSGVIRRHPDIKHLRQPQDITENMETQRQLLAKLWSVLKVGGNMLYCTCSIFRQENDLQAAWLLENNPDAKLIPLPERYGLEVNIGRQRLPGVDDSDGFYYAYFEKYPS